MAVKKIRALFVATVELENDVREVIGVYEAGQIVELAEDSFQFWAAQNKCMLAPEEEQAQAVKASSVGDDTPATKTQEDVSKIVPDETDSNEAVTEGASDDDASKNAKPGTGSRGTGSKANNRRRG